MEERHAGEVSGEEKKATVKNHDQILIDRVLTGDQKAFELLVRQYQGKVSAVVSRYVDDPDKVRDLVQETWIKAYRALPGFRGESTFFTWLYRIATNVTKNHWLAAGKTISISELEEDIEGEYVLPQLQDHETPERQLLRKEMMENVQAAIDSLVPSMKKAILLRDVQGLSYEEIAEVLDCPVGTVRSRIFRGRQEIANRMRSYLGERGRSRVSGNVSSVVSA
ncbi:sigma-70 family RNA polymerase sigma factor [Candidatus Magnetaquicoccus inordinatus]|uniref:sigma-70 family RNA polymerase sigma factor n=1 Tax=Candidatus Magnetaquicoccus inordinatus TaxID=2496818 RepID=UPI00102CC579|nr:sigma-70 family RNA polymerase sigma factor [Candidatus Magnetaquicoccus inordinatus]